jgi:TolB-like protein
MGWLWIGLAAAACLMLGVLGWIGHIRHAEPTSLAVLPLRNESGDSRLDYLGVGLTQALTNDLAEMPGLQVKAEGIAEQYSAHNADLGEFGKRINVRSLVRGSFVNLGGHLRIPVEMIDVNTGSQIWGKTYEGDISNIAELQNEISTDIAYHLKIRLNPDLEARLKRQYTTVPAAYDAYLKGRYRLTLRSPEDLREAVTEFQDALSTDPRYAPAYAGLADSYILLAHYGSSRQIPMMTNALKAADQALALDSTLGEAYASRALARTGLSYEWKQAENDYTRALELNPTI